MLKVPTKGAGYIAPLKPTLVSEPPDGDGWIHELKHDGYRVQVVVEGSSIRVFTKNGHDWTDRFRCIAQDAGYLPTASAVIDGEAIVQDEHGRSDFFALQKSMDEAPERVVMFAFDLLWLDGVDLRGLPLIERRAMLREILGDNQPGAAIQFSDDVADGAALFAAAEQLDLEGIVSKKASSRYRSGYQTTWLKTKCMTESAFTVIGAERGQGTPSFALLAREVDGVLEYAGSAFVTLKDAERERFWRGVDQLVCDAPAVPMSKGYNAKWCRPEMQVSARHLKGSDKLRHASLSKVIA
jgi:bifunctional non-homologous end joining protein LigD